MNTNVKFVLDSSSDIPWDISEKLGIEVVPLSVTIYNEEFKENKDFDIKSYYEHFEKDPNFIPKTSQPSPGEFMEAYFKLVEEGVKDIIVITISSALSGTYNSARLAADELKEFEEKVNVYLVDSKNASYPAVFLMRHGMELLEKGMNPEEVAKVLNEQAVNIKTHILVPTLKYLHMGGRLSSAKYMMGRLLKTKPIISVDEEGKLFAADKVTTINDGLDRLIELSVPDPNKLPNQVAFVHTNAEELAKELAERFKVKYPEVPYEIILSRTTISAHVGPKGVSIISDYFNY